MDQTPQALLAKRIEERNPGMFTPKPIFYKPQLARNPFQINTPISFNQNNNNKNLSN